MNGLQYNVSIGCLSIWQKYGIIIGKLWMFICVTMEIEKLYANQLRTVNVGRFTVLNFCRLYPMKFLLEAFMVSYVRQWILYVSRHTVVCQWPRETQDPQCIIYRKQKVADFNPLYLLHYLEDFYQIYIFYALHICNLTYQI